MSMNTESEYIEIMDGNLALQAADRAQIDIQISTARAYPRDIDKCKKDAVALATMDEETAASMFYVLPRGGKNIEGPSTRLAEVVANSWEHIRVEARVDSIDDKFLTAVATGMDLQKNVAFRSSVRRRITDKYGKRYKDDMIVVAANAACSIASRNVIFKIVPFAFVKGIYEQARRVAVGDAKSFNKNRDMILGNLVKAGCNQDAILAYFGYNGTDSFTMDDLITLRGTFNSIREGNVTVEQAFAIDPDSPPPNSEAVDVKKDPPKNGAAKAESPKAEEKPAETAPTDPPY